MCFVLKCFLFSSHTFNTMFLGCKALFFSLLTCIYLEVFLKKHAFGVYSLYDSVSEYIFSLVSHMNNLIGYSFLLSKLSSLKFCKYWPTLTSDGHLDWFHLLAIHLCTRFCLNTCFNSGCIPRTGFAGSYANSLFNFLRDLQTVFHSRFTTLLSHQQCIRTPSNFFTSSSTYVISWFLNIVISILLVILLVMKWYPLVIPQGFNYHNFAINLISALANVFSYISLETIRLLLFVYFSKWILYKFFQVPKKKKIVM